MSRRFRITFILLLVAAMLIRLISDREEWIEKYYSSGIYPIISSILKYCFGWLPFSLGDILYGLAGIWLVYRIIRIIKALIKKQYGWERFGTGILKAITVLVGLYVIFNSLWGLNYNRKGIAHQLGIQMNPYSKEELIIIDSILIDKVNASKSALVYSKQSPLQKQVIFNKSVSSYQGLSAKYPFLKYAPSSIKSSMWGWLGNYIGFTGYYNPFTGEAQVNTTVPGFLQPFITCHEIAHQLGYAKENEANFVGYLAAAASDDTAFHYSVYLDLFLYAQRNLYMVDSATAKSFSKKIIPAVKADLDEWRKFNRKHESVMEPVFDWLYGKYLKSNRQPSGILSYDEVTGFLVAYYKKFGRL